MPNKMRIIYIPENFARTIAALYGEAGRAWLARLPSLVAAYAQQWSLTVWSPVEPLSYNYVAPAMRADGRDVVLKVRYPTPELYTEIEALQCYDGHGIVQLLEVSREHLFTELLASMMGPVLLHGDLHHGNILAAERQPWLALDPKGVLGGTGV
jgi:streptomycin 6-kinase